MGALARRSVIAVAIVGFMVCAPYAGAAAQTPTRATQPAAPMPRTVPKASASARPASSAPTPSPSASTPPSDQADAAPPPAPRPSDGPGIGTAILVGMVGLFGLGWWWKVSSEKKQRAALWNYYQWSLANMRHDPTARAGVVNAGRAWYGHLRGGGVTMYDELAISNDIKQAGG